MIIGHEKIWQFLNNSSELNKISHAYLFSGPEKIGKKTLAVEFTKRLFKEDVTKKQHPDFILIEPQKKDIQISQIRECIWKLSLTPSVAPFKIAIIDDAHCLNPEAQNSLLKTLEEPKGKAILFLITEHPERLFSTILSRCQILKFYPVKKEKIVNYLKSQKVAESKIEEIVENSRDRPGLAIDFLLNPEKLKIQKEKISDLVKILDSDLAYRFQYANDLSREPQNIKDALSIWLAYFRDILISNVSNLSQKKYSFENKSKLDSAVSTAKLRNITKLIQETNFLINTTNVNPRLALEILMLEL